jgi:hypothetical protein
MLVKRLNADWVAIIRSNIRSNSLHLNPIAGEENLKNTGTSS